MHQMTCLIAKPCRGSILLSKTISLRNWGQPGLYHSSSILRETSLDAVHTRQESQTNSTVETQPLSHYINFKNFQFIEGNQDLSKYCKDVPFLPIFQYPKEILKTDGVPSWKRIYRKGKFILKYYFYGIKNILIYIKNAKIMSKKHNNVKQHTDDMVKKIEYKFMQIAQKHTSDDSLLSMKQLSQFGDTVTGAISERRLFEQENTHYLNNDLVRFVWFSGIVLVFEEISLLIFLFLLPRKLTQKVIPYNCNIPELLVPQVGSQTAEYRKATTGCDYLKGSYISPFKANIANSLVDEHYLKYIFLDDLMILKEMVQLEQQPVDTLSTWYKEELIQKCCERFLIDSQTTNDFDIGLLQRALEKYLVDKYATDLDINKRFGVWNVYTLGIPQK